MLDDRIDVSRIKSMAEALKKENMLLPRDIDRYRSIEFAIRYTFAGNHRLLCVIGHFWNKKLEIKQNIAWQRIWEPDNPQLNNDLVELIIFFRDYFF